MDNLIQQQSGDLVTVFFQKIGPFKTFLLMSFVGVGIHILAWQSGLYWRAGDIYCKIDDLNQCSKGFLLNISWSFTILILFPVIFYAVTRFYNNAYMLLESFDNKIFLSKVIAKINRKGILLFYGLLPVLWWLYFYSIIDSATWTWNFVSPACNGKANCSTIHNAINSITATGVVTTLYHILNGLYIICLIRAVKIGSLIAMEVTENKDRYSFAHPDGLYGFSKIREYLKDTYIIIGLLTVYIILYVLDKFIIQHELSNALFIATIYTSAWLIFLYLIRARIAAPIENLMKKIKEDELTRLQKEIESMSKKGGAYNNLWDTKTKIEALPENIIEFKFWRTLGIAPFISLAASPGVLTYIKNSGFYKAFIELLKHN